MMRARAVIGERRTKKQSAIKDTKRGGLQQETPGSPRQNLPHCLQDEHPYKCLSGVPPAEMPGVESVRVPERVLVPDSHAVPSAAMHADQAVASRVMRAAIRPQVSRKQGRDPDYESG